MKETNAEIEQHIRHFFAGHAANNRHWSRDPVTTALPRLRILEIAPGSRASLWSYVTVGAWEARPDNPLEFLMVTAEPNDRYVELLSIVAFYALEHTLAPGDTIAIGEPLFPDSKCEYVYLSVPYTYGSKLEHVRTGENYVHIYWVFPLAWNSIVGWKIGIGILEPSHHGVRLRTVLASGEVPHHRSTPRGTRPRRGRALVQRTAIRSRYRVPRCNLRSL